MERRYYVIDVFTHERFAGNPAAVVLDTEHLSDRRMQAIAAEFNLSETTFVLPLQTRGIDAPTERTIPIRWFTPAAEVSMCGHATIAAVHALVESDVLSAEKHGSSAPLQIETRSGMLTAFIEPLAGREGRRMIWLELLPPSLAIHAVDSSELAAALRLGPERFESTLPMMETQDRDLIVFVQDMVSLNDATPDFTALSGLLSRERLRGLSLATVNTVTPSVSLQSRFFCPTVGVDEDPVTGSVHGPLAAYLVKRGLIPVHDGVAGFMAVQGKPGGRTGLVSALVEVKEDDRYTVRIGGEAVTTMRGVVCD